MPYCRYRPTPAREHWGKNNSRPAALFCLRCPPYRHIISTLTHPPPTNIWPPSPRLLLFNFPTGFCVSGLIVAEYNAHFRPFIISSHISTRQTRNRINFCSDCNIDSPSSVYVYHVAYFLIHFLEAVISSPRCWYAILVNWKLSKINMSAGATTYFVCALQYTQCTFCGMYIFRSRARPSAIFQSSFTPPLLEVSLH